MPPRPSSRRRRYFSASRVPSGIFDVLDGAIRRRASRAIAYVASDTERFELPRGPTTPPIGSSINLFDPATVLGRRAYKSVESQVLSNTRGDLAHVVEERGCRA